MSLFVLISALLSFFLHLTEFVICATMILQRITAAAPSGFLLPILGNFFLFTPV
nr:MAG TPA_asm: hypothetical protein [Caudoviricetes sp.]